MLSFVFHLQKASHPNEKKKSYPFFYTSLKSIGSGTSREWVHFSSVLPAGEENRACVLQLVLEGNPSAAIITRSILGNHLLSHSFLSVKDDIEEESSLQVCPGQLRQAPCRRVSLLA